MQSDHKIKFFQRFDMVGVSKKNCSDILTYSNNQSVLVATHKTLYKLQFADGKYSINHMKISSKSDEEEYHLIETYPISRNETYIFVCTRVESKETNEVLVFRNDFKDLVDAVFLPFKPIMIKHFFINETLYTVFSGEAMTAAFTLTNQKEKKLSLAQIFEVPSYLANVTGAVSMNYYIDKNDKKQIYVSSGYFDGEIKFSGFAIETEEKINEKQAPKFFTKQHTFHDETKFQLPITATQLDHLTNEDIESGNLSLVASSSLGYLIVFDNILKNRFSNPLILPLKNESKLDTIMDCVVFDIDDDGDKEIIAITYLAELFVIKKEDNALKVIASKEVDACFFNVYVEKQGDKKFIILCGDNEVKIFEYIKDK